ncbi:arabinofuranosidase catalytic domain-containing protein [Streptosporangium soli]|nr:hypothetical protein [Streptosporangium sp. KLBMP 9127]
MSATRWPTPAISPHETFRCVVLIGHLIRREGDLDTHRGDDLWYQGSSPPEQARDRDRTESLTIGGNEAYSLHINPGTSYWRDGHLTGVPTGSAPEGMYMVTSGTHINSGCCFDYGNSVTTRKADAPGAMDAINFSTQCCPSAGPVAAAISRRCRT